MRMIVDRIFRVLEIFITGCLAAMVVLVFGNAVLRKLSDYGIVLFGGGLDWSEELSRVLFVWLTFVGAVVVARDGAHLGVETLVARFGEAGRKALMVASDVLVLICCAVFFWGTWRQAPLHLGNHAPVTGISMIWVYGFGFVASIGIGLVTLARIIRTLTGTVSPEEVRRFAGEYDIDPEHSPKVHLE